MGGEDFGVPTENGSGGLKAGLPYSSSHNSLNSIHRPHWPSASGHPYSLRAAGAVKQHAQQPLNKAPGVLQRNADGLQPNGGGKGKRGAVVCSAGHSGSKRCAGRDGQILAPVGKKAQHSTAQATAGQERTTQQPSSGQVRQPHRDGNADLSLRCVAKPSAHSTAPPLLPLPLPSASLATAPLQCCPCSAHRR